MDLSVLNNLPWGAIVPSLCVALCVIALWIVAGRAHRAYLAKNDKGKASTVSRVIMDVVRFVLVAGGILLVLQICGVNVTAAVAGLGIASAAVALAMQDFLKDVIMGIHMISDNFFAEGDAVLLDGKEGVVKRFTLKTTKVELLDTHSVVSVCNRKLEQIERLSEQIDIDVPQPYGEDPEKIHAVLKQTAQKLASAEGIKRCLYLGTQTFESSAILYRIRFFCAHRDRPDMRRAAYTQIQKDLAANGLQVPFNQLDVHLDQR